MNRRGLIGKSELMQGFIEPVTAPVSGEHAARSVPSMRRWRKAQNIQTGSGVSEPGYRFPPIGPFTKLPSLVRCNPHSIGNQPTTTHAGDNLLIQDFQAQHGAQSTTNPNRNPACCAPDLLLASGLQDRNEPSMTEGVDA